MVYKRQLVFQTRLPIGVRYKQVAIRWPQKQIVLRWFSENAVSLLAPNHENPNLFSIGEGFGLFILF